MNRVIGIVGALVLAIALSACGDHNHEHDSCDSTENALIIDRKPSPPKPVDTKPRLEGKKTNPFGKASKPKRKKHKDSIDDIVEDVQPVETHVDEDC